MIGPFLSTYKDWGHTYYEARGRAGVQGLNVGPRPLGPEHVEDESVVRAVERAAAEVEDENHWKVFNLIK